MSDIEKNNPETGPAPAPSKKEEIKNVRRAMLQLAWPVIIQNIFMAFMILGDTIMLGHYREKQLVLAAIGISEIIHAANRGELITTVFVNNAIYGMTGGQMSPTTLPGMVTTSTPDGRDCAVSGYPIKLSEILAQTAGAVYITRQSATDIVGIHRTKRAIKRAFLAQIHGLGFACVEVLATCPTNWSVDPWVAMQWAREHLAAFYPVETFKMTDEVKALDV